MITDTLAEKQSSAILLGIKERALQLALDNGVTEQKLILLFESAILVGYLMGAEDFRRISN